MKETAVEWLFEKLWDTSKDKFTWYAILKQAKEMEKEQIIDAWFGGYLNGEIKNKLASENYYNETFKSEQ